MPHEEQTATGTSCGADLPLFSTMQPGLVSVMCSAHPQTQFI
jgi:hypothetical protein